MPDLIEQTKVWTGEFGREYTNRNAISQEELDSEYRKRYGISRTEMNTLMLSEFDPSCSIAEVGCNVGNQLLLLLKMGFSELHGIEVQRLAIELLRSRSRNLRVVRGTVFHIPFRNASFDLVFTSGLLIHVHPNDILAAMVELHRCARKYLWGFEYYAENYTAITYRGHDNLLWKADFAKMYLDRFDDLELTKEIRFRNLDDPRNVDSMFLLEKSA